MAEDPRSKPQFQTRSAKKVQTGTLDNIDQVVVRFTDDEPFWALTEHDAEAAAKGLLAAVKTLRDRKRIARH